MNFPERVRLGAAEVARLIRDDIDSGRLKPHDRLPAERSLAEQFGVARGTVREALNQLVSEDLIEVKRGSGAYVLESETTFGRDIVRDARPLELVDTRFALEPHICRLAVLNARPSDLQRLDELLEIMENAVGDPSGFAAADMEFHNLLAESTGNRLLAWIISQISQVRNEEQWGKMLRLTLSRDTIRAYNQHHRGIVEAIRRRNPDGAAGLMKSHLQAARDSLIRSSAT